MGGGRGLEMRLSVLHALMLFNDSDAKGEVDQV